MDFSSLSKVVLVGLVKAVRKQPTGQGWSEFIQEHSPNSKALDPAHHSREVLAKFVVHCQAAASQGTDANKFEKLIRRYLKWHSAKDQDRNCKLAKDLDLKSEPGKVWRLVQRTHQHERFISLYSFPSYTKGWHCCPRRVQLGVGRPRLLALDCEMCATVEEGQALLGVCVTDEQGCVVYKSLVKPRGEVVDYRSALTGVTAADLEGIKVRRKHARAAVKALLSGGDVILVGHALHHDLAALRLDYRPVIDTSLIFGFEALPRCTPSLSSLSRAVLGTGMREETGGAHDMQEDASVAMALVRHELEHGPSAPLPAPDTKVSKDELRKLLVHSIPKDATLEQVKGMLAGATGFQSVEGDLAARKVLLVFAQPADANVAFKNLPGKQGTDSVGRATKEVALGAGASVKVRKMGCHNGAAFGRDLHPTAPKAKQPGSSKRRRAASANGRPAGAAPGAAAAAPPGGQAKGKPKAGWRNKGPARGKGEAGKPARKWPQTNNKQRPASGGAGGADKAKRPGGGAPQHGGAAGGEAAREPKRRRLDGGGKENGGGGASGKRGGGAAGAGGVGKGAARPAEGERGGGSSQKRQKGNGAGAATA